MAPPIEAELRARRTAIVRGELTLDALDSHHDLAQLKVAGLIAMLDGRTTITVDDWGLAATFKTISKRVRAGVVGHLAFEAQERERATTNRLVRRDAAIADAALNRFSRLHHAAEFLETHPSITPTRSRGLQEIYAVNARAAVPVLNLSDGTAF